MPDLLSKFLETLSPRCYVATGMDAPPDLALRYDAFPGIKLMSVDQGVFFVSVSADADERIELHEGDAIALVAPEHYILATSASAAPRAARDVNFKLSDGLALYGDSSRTSVRVFAGKMVPDNAVAQFFFSALPPVLVIRRNEGGDSIRRMMRIIHFERLGREPGSEYAASRLIDLVMLDVIRFALRLPDAAFTTNRPANGPSACSPKPPTCRARDSRTTSAAFSARRPWNTWCAGAFDLPCSACAIPMNP